MNTVEVIEISNVSELPAFPKDIYTMRILEGSAKKTQAGDVMYNLDCEIVTPESVVLKDKEGVPGVYKIAGLHVPLMFLNKITMRKGNKEALRLLGLNDSVTFDENLMNEEVKLFKGLGFKAIFSGTQEEETKTEIDPITGEAKRVAIIDDNTGKPYTNLKVTIWPSAIKAKVELPASSTPY